MKDNENAVIFFFSVEPCEFEMPECPKETVPFVRQKDESHYETSPKSNCTDACRYLKCEVLGINFSLEYATQKPFKPLFGLYKNVLPVVHNKS